MAKYCEEKEKENNMKEGKLRRNNRSMRKGKKMERWGGEIRMTK